MPNAKDAGTKEKEIVFIYGGWSRFQETVVRILSSKYKVIPVKCRNFPDVINILRHINNKNISISYFAGRHALATVLLSKFFNHKTIVIAAGSELEKKPDVTGNYLFNLVLRIITKISLIFADHIITVSAYLYKRAKEIVPDRTVYLCYAPNTIDTDYFSPKGEKEKNLIVTVGRICPEAYMRKGVFMFKKCAENMPDCKFIWAGLLVNDKFLKKIKIPPNMEIRKNVPKDELLELYRKAAVYCQLSYSEGFGVAVGEAMACECVPVTTARDGMAEIVGEAGIIVPYGDLQKTIEGIRKAMNSPELGKIARMRVIKNYSYHIHAPKFLALVDKIYNSSFR